MKTERFLTHIKKAGLLIIAMLIMSSCRFLTTGKTDKSDRTCGAGVSPLECAAPAAPTSLTYTTNNATYTMGEAITDNTPTADSTIASYTVSPNLPTGLSLNESTGVISGTPSTLSIQATYTVTATNESGSTTHDVFIAVVDRAPSLLSYTTNSPNYEVNAIIKQ